MWNFIHLLPVHIQKRHFTIFNYSKVFEVSEWPRSPFLRSKNVNRTKYASRLYTVTQKTCHMNNIINNLPIFEVSTIASFHACLVKSLLVNLQCRLATVAGCPRSPAALELHGAWWVNNKCCTKITKKLSILDEYIKQTYCLRSLRHSVIRASFFQ